MNSAPIGIIDSGVGGLSIYQEIKSLLPTKSIIYLCDQKFAPYGTRSDEQITDFSKRMVAFLVNKGVKLVVIACNTISVTCLDELRQTFFPLPIIGTVPVVKTAAKVSKNKSIGILATKRTAESLYQQQLIEKFASDCMVTTIGTTKLVPLVEKGNTHGLVVQKILQADLQPFITHNVDTIALACTHFPFLKDEIANVLGFDSAILDSSGAVARQTQRVVAEHGILSGATDPQHVFYTTGKAAAFKAVAKKLLKTQVGKVELIVL